MLRFRVILTLIVLLLAVVVTAQEDSDSPGDGLVAQDVEVLSMVDIYGQTVFTAEGVLINQSETAFSDIALIAEIYDASGTVVGEGFGFPVNACGTGLLPDFALQPQESQVFSVTLEFYADGAEIDRVDVRAQGTSVDEALSPLPDDLVGITRVTDQEVVQVEWTEPRAFRFGVGCDQDAFTALDWYSTTLDGEGVTLIEHPNTINVTDALLTQLGLTDPYLYNRSFLTFPVNTRRIVYQTDINTVLTAEPDGSFKRLIYDTLSRISLHGFIWLPEGRFLAYYYGAYGEEVRYFTASLEGQLISASPFDVLPSTIIPGSTPDGGRAVIATTVDGITGYYLKDTFYQGNELLFEGNAPGNNYPAPLYAINAAGQAFIYLIRLVNDAPTLQCFDMQIRQLNNMTVLPLELTFDSRAWTWLSPDGTTIALATNGEKSGLWLIDLNQLGTCSTSLPG